MDGDGDGGMGGGLGGMNDPGMRNADGDVGAAPGSSDDDSAAGTLRSMGYIDNGAEVGGADGGATDSEDSVLQTVAILAIVAFFVLSFGYFLLQAILAMFGVSV